MATPIDLLDNSPLEPSEETSEKSDNTNGGSEIVEPNGAEDEFWVKYPYIKSRLVATVAEGSLPENFLESVKLIGDENAKKLNDMCKTLLNTEMDLCKARCDLVVSAISIFKSGN